MITEIDLREVLARSVGSPHNDLVTRATGVKVRSSIEAALSANPAGAAVVLDFSAVRVLDCSCADEVVAKLVLQRGQGLRGEICFVIRGLAEGQAEEIDHVLRRRRLALVSEEPGSRPRLLGEVEPSAAAAWEILTDRGSAAAEEIALALCLAIEDSRRALASLVEAGVARQAEGGRYLPLTAA